MPVGPHLSRGVNGLQIQATHNTGLAEVTVMPLLSWMTFAVSVAGAAQEAEPPEAIQWNFEQPRRYAIRTNMRLPEMIWLGTRFNRQARFDAMDLRMVLQCAPAERESRRSWEIDCRIEDFAMSAEALPQERGIVQDIVTELDERLTGGLIQFQVRNDGRIKNVGLHEIGRLNRRVGVINENMRLVLSRMVAGLDLPLPRPGEEDGWVQHSSWIMQTVNRWGSYGTSEIVHQVKDVAPAHITIASAGRGIIIPEEGRNKFRARMVSETVFDRRDGHILDRTWSLVGGPTASSLIAQGTEGYPYLVEGQLVALSPGQEWSVGESLELERSQPGMSAIQQRTMRPPLR